MSAGAIEPNTPLVRGFCGFCGRKLAAHVGHYDVVRCECGVAFWALRPSQSRKLEFFPWPGRDQDEAFAIRGRRTIVSRLPARIVSRLPIRQVA